MNVKLYSCVVKRCGYEWTASIFLSIRACVILIHAYFMAVLGDHRPVLLIFLLNSIVRHSLLTKSILCICQKFSFCSTLLFFVMFMNNVSFINWSWIEDSVGMITVLERFKRASLNIIALLESKWIQMSCIFDNDGGSLRVCIVTNRGLSW